MKRKYEIIKTNEKGERIIRQSNRVLRKISELGITTGTVTIGVACIDLYIKSQQVNYMIM